jgi:hypothetical protein
MGSTAVVAEDAGPAAEPVKRPAYNPVMPQNEDWSVLAGRDLSTTGDLFDPIKYIALNEDGSIWMSFGGQVRVRVEDWNNFGFAAANDDTFVLTRELIHGDLHVGEHVRVFAEGKNADSTERDLPGGRRTLDADQLDLEQGFADFMLPMDELGSLTLRVGRQHLLIGSERLVSPLPWSNTQRSWDGVAATWDMESCQVTGFWTQFAPVQKYSFNDAVEAMQLFGVYADGKLAETGANLGLYWLGVDNDSNTFNGTTGHEERHTLGGRLHGLVADTTLDYDLEGAYQVGDLGGNDIDAYFFASELGYKIPQCPSRPRVWVGFDYASGDESTGGDVQTFNQLFPLGHKYLGYMDFVGRQNIVDLNTGVGVKPMDKLGVNVAGHYFWRAETSDALYNAGGGVVRGGAAGTSRHVGAEIDLTVTYQVDRHTNLLAGYSHFFASTFIEQTGSSEDMDFTYLQLQYNF